MVPFLAVPLETAAGSTECNGKWEAKPATLPLASVSGTGIAPTFIQLACVIELITPTLNVTPAVT